MTGALAGLRVLDIASLYAAPYAATLLADFGADVVKIEPPGGDGFRGTRMWPAVARGKRSLVLDLRNKIGQDALRSMIAHADVLVENLPKRTMEQRGLDWATLSAINPRLIMLSLSCFGQTGPYADRPGSGTIAEAFSGLTHLTGHEDGPPLLPSVALGDAIGAMNAVIGVMMAIYWRDHGGTGQQVDASLYEPVLAAITQAFQFWESGTSRPARRGSRIAVGDGLRNVYLTQDEHYVAISASTARHAAALVELSGGVGDGDTDSAVARWITTQPLEALITTLVNARIPVAPVNSIDALIHDPQIIARGSIVRTHDPDLGPLITTAPAPKLCATPGLVRDFGIALGEGGVNVLAEWSSMSVTQKNAVLSLWTDNR